MTPSRALTVAIRDGRSNSSSEVADLRHVNKLPDDLFIATDATKASLFASINKAQGK